MDLSSLPAWTPFAGMAASFLIGLAAAVSAARARSEQLKEQAAELEMQILLGNVTTEEIVNADTTVQVPWVSRQLQIAGWNFSGVPFVLLSVAFAFMVGFVVFVRTLAFAPSALTAVVVLAIPFIALSVASRRARSRFGEQLVAALPMMTTLIKGGSTTQQAIVAVSENLVEPARTEFTRIARELSVGAKLEDAVLRSARRTKSSDMDYFARAVGVQAQYGGELSTILEAITDSIRGRITMRAMLKSKVAQPKFEMVIVTALPWILFFWFSVSVPSYVRVFWEEPIGWFLLAVAIVLDVAGFLLMRHFVNMRIE